jgi:CheY-like chemotaxis protein
MFGQQLQQLRKRATRMLRGRQGAVPRVLCADDDEAVRMLCVTTLERSGYVVDVAANGREALDRIEQRRYSAILLDLGLSHLHGTTLLSLLRQHRPEVLDRVIVITGASDAGLIGTEGVRLVVKKPFDRLQLLEAVHDCCAFDDTVSLRERRARPSGSAVK